MNFDSITIGIEPIDEFGFGDTEHVVFRIDEEMLYIDRDKTGASIKEPEKYKAIDGFSVCFEIDDAKKLRDFLVFALSEM